MLRGEVDVAANQTQTVALVPDDDEDAILPAGVPASLRVGMQAQGAPGPAVDVAGRAPPSAAEDAARAAAPVVDVAPRAGAPAAAGPASTPAAVPASQLADVAIRLISGNVLAGECTPLDGTRWSLTPTGSGAELTVPGQDAPCLVQIWQRGQAPANMMVPTSEGHPCRLSITQGSDGRYAAWATLSNPSADLLVRFAYRADAKRSNAVAPALDAQQLLEGKLRDPISAVVGAYALLKLGDLDRLHEWTEPLRRYFPWLPDGLAVRGEHLARLGRHAEACDAFVELPSRGLPISTDGLSWSVDRLRGYARAAPGTLSPDRRARAEAVLGQLQAFALTADFRCPFTAYPGADPRQPSVELAAGDTPQDARRIG